MMGTSRRLMRKKIRQEIRNDRKHRRKQTARRRVQFLRSVLFSMLYQVRVMFENLAGFMRILLVIIKEKHLRRDLFRTALNSTVLFILAFIVARYSSLFLTIAIAHSFGIPSTLFSYGIYWPLNTYSSLYSPSALIIIFGSGPLLNLLLGVGMFAWYSNFRRHNMILKTFFVWMIFHAFNMFFGSYIASLLTRSEFIYAIEWMFQTRAFDLTEQLFLYVSIVIMILVGVRLTRQFIFAANSKTLVSPQVRIYYLLSAAFFPWIAGNAFLVLMNYPRHPLHLIILHSASVLMIIPVFFNLRRPGIQMIRIRNLSEKVYIGWIYIILLVVVVLLVRIYMFPGIPIGWTAGTSG